MRRIRLHTRLPIVLPERVTDRLIEILLEAGPVPFVVVHSNHPRELAGSCAAALRRLVRQGITVLNQAVLLKGVNDTLEVQMGLCEALVEPVQLVRADEMAFPSHCGAITGGPQQIGNRRQMRRKFRPVIERANRRHQHGRCQQRQLRLRS